MQEPVMNKAVDQAAEKKPAKPVPAEAQPAPTEFAPRYVIQGNRKSRVIRLRDGLEVPAHEFVQIKTKRDLRKVLRFNNRAFYTVLEMPEGWKP